ncbi:methyl-accepting chemotaxis sensory transducer [Desulforamulus reducens MI-1]|uniref:Methyl-accepting chemotaxis sensory transducer n=1 Tax=Desulforamulus reducens (strain ATCC BAA-1160 / DSM 100696 / MI-1) TaxID=349161 RepID=A4J861_DESRM|nr:methyl-accepting chemotaxis protein [Desulforamulus reducens]ABO51264.1 methyl-accepting chemotaxis sensory transducer [Desulforamulus reducens MI-1]
MFKNKTSLNFQISFIFIALLIISIVTISYYTLYNLKKEIEKVTLESQQTKAKSVVMNVEDFINTSMTIVRFSSNLPEVKDMSAVSLIREEFKGVPENADLEKRNIAKSLLKEYPDFAYFESFTGDKGINIMLEPYKYQVGLSRMDFAFRDWFKGATGSMNTYISEVYLSASINKHVVAISTPIKDEYSQLTGVWLGALTLDVLSEKVKNLTFGRTGKIYLVDKNGVIAAHPNKEFTSKITKLDKHPIVSKLLNGQSGTGYYYEPLEKTDVIATFMPVGKTGWGVVVEQSVSEAFGFLNDITHNVIITSLVVSLLAMLFVLCYTRRITKPIDNISTLAAHVAQGDLNVEVQVCHSNSDLEKLTTSFKLMVEHLKNLIEEITLEGQRVHETAKQLSVSTQQTSIVASENASAMSQISSAVENVSDSTIRVSGHSQKVINLAQDGKVAIDNVIKQMDNISNSTNRVSSVVSNLTDNSSKITQIVDLINQIAEQTNLLALNAAIEAARAGEYGRGFSVVADEVKRLSEQSSAATKEIYQLISNIHRDSHTAVASIGENVGVVKDGITITSQAGDSFENINQLLQTLNNEITSVAASIEQIAAGIQHIAGSTEEQTASSEEIASLSESLLTVANQLNKTAEKFK